MIYQDFCGSFVPTLDLEHILSKCERLNTNHIRYTDFVSFKSTYSITQCIEDIHKRFALYDLKRAQCSTQSFQNLDSTKLIRRGLMHKNEVQLLLRAIMFKDTTNQSESMVLEYDGDGDSYLEVDEVIKLIMAVAAGER